MKTILVPTDFSDTAANALRYAVELSGSLLEPLDLVLLHVYEAAQLPAGTPRDLAEKEAARAEEEVLEQLKSHARWYCRHSGIRHTKVAAIRGSLSEAIARAAEHFEADLVVMGTKGISGINAFLLNSNTAELVERASCPVLAVPQQISFTPILKIVFAADLSRSDIPDLQKVVDLAQVLNAQVQVVHVSGIGEEADDALRIVNFWSQVQQQVPYEWLDFINIEADEVAAGLEKFLQEQQADLLVTSPKKRSVFLQFLHSSITRQLVLDAVIPVLALDHHKDEREAEVWAAEEDLPLYQELRELYI